MMPDVPLKEMHEMADAELGDYLCQLATAARYVGNIQADGVVEVLRGVADYVETNLREAGKWRPN